MTCLLPLLPGPRFTALAKAGDPALVLAKQRFHLPTVGERGQGWRAALDGSASVADLPRVRPHLGISPAPNLLNLTGEHQREVEERLEDFSVGYAVFHPSGRQASHKTTRPSASMSRTSGRGTIDYTRQGWGSTLECRVCTSIS